MSIQAINISKYYGQQEVLHQVSFTVEKGSIVSFLGANGAGKSTCIRIITGGITPDSGKVIICGHTLQEASLKAKYCMGYLPENNPLYPEMYVHEYLEYVANLYRIPSLHKVEEMIEKIKLTEVLGRTIGTLSKGYRQRVGLAQALIHDPEIVILDEPFTGLDPNQLDEMYTLIKELGEKKAILFSSHSLTEVKEIAEHIIIFSQGKIVANSSLAELTKAQSLNEVFKQLTYENSCR